MSVETEQALGMQFQMPARQPETIPTISAGPNRKPLPAVDMLDRLAHAPVVKQVLGWKLAICQHPMYLLIDEDRGEPVVGERVPPWGAPDAAEYADRVRRNLSSLAKLPDLRLTYQFSAVEVDNLCRAFPDVHQTMRDSYQKRLLDFIDGSYSQPHFCVLGSESNWRQYEYGLEVYERLFGRRITLYGDQESGLHQQLPQILRKFGYEMMIAPPFPWAMEVVEGPIEFTGSFKGLSAVEGDDFAHAMALDGTCIPIYLKMFDSEHDGKHEDLIRAEIGRDHPRSPRIWMLFPDMIEMHEEKHKRMTELYELVIFEEALRERLLHAPPRAKIRVYNRWSYSGEGAWAEELLRTIRQTEEAILLTENMHAMVQASGKAPGYESEIASFWKTFLKYQHHDVAWIEVTDLRRQAIEQMRSVRAKCASIRAEAASMLLKSDASRVSIFNGLPHPRRAIVELDPSEVPSDSGAWQRIGDRVVGFVDLPAGGAASFSIGGAQIPESTSSTPFTSIRTEHYSVELSPEGLIQQLWSANGTSLLNNGDIRGGEVRALINDKWCNNRSALCRYHQGPVAKVLERIGLIDTIRFREQYCFFQHEPLIRLDLTFDFNGDQIGYFWLDETKLNLHWPIANSAEIYHDIPFGYIPDRPDRTMFSLNWTYCGGMTLVNRGTVKHYVRDGVLRNVLAWGGNSFSNRLPQFGWPKKNEYDIRLYGAHTLSFFILPTGSFDGPGLVRRVQDLTYPVHVSRGATEEGARSFYRESDTSVATTAVFAKDGEICHRGYQFPQTGNATKRYRDFEIFNGTLR